MSRVAGPWALTDSADAVNTDHHITTVTAGR